MIKHDLLYCVHFKGQSIPFWPDVSKFADELAKLFPDEKIISFDFIGICPSVSSCFGGNTEYTTPDETDLN